MYDFLNKHEKSTSMQRFPSGGSPGVQRSTLLKIISVIVVLGLITYFINRQFGTYYAWVFVFFIILNAYFGWRAYRRSIRDPSQHAHETTLQTGEDYIIEENTTPTGQQERWQILEKQYEHCAECQAELIPGLSYCEECGTSLSQ